MSTTTPENQRTKAPQIRLIKIVGVKKSETIAQYHQKILFF